MKSPTSLALFAAAATLAVTSAEYGTSSEYFTGDGTSYTLSDTTNGNCNMMSSLSFATTDHAALNNEQWDGLQNCGRCAEVTCDDKRCTDTTTPVVVQILDRCPECKHGDLDLSPSVFKTLTGSDPSRYTIKWKFVDCPVTGNVNYCLKGGSNNFWTAIQPTNVATGIKSLQINGKATKMLDGAYYYLLDGAGKSSTDLSKVTVSLMDINGVSMKDTLNLSAGKCTEGAKQFPKAGGSPPSKTGAPKTNTTVPATTPKPAAPAPTPVPVTAAPKVPVTPAPVTPAPETPAPVTQTESPAVPASTPAVPASTPTVTTSTPSQEQQTPAPVEYTPTPVEQTETEAPSTTGPVSEDSSYIDVLDCGKNSQQGSSNDQTQQSGVGGENSADSPDVPATVAPVEQGSDAQTPYQQSSGDGNNEYSTPEPTVQPTSGSSSVGGEAENPSQDAPISQGSDDTLHGSDVAGSEDQNTPATEAPSSPKDCPM